jgi:hypothetical protein
MSFAKVFWRLLTGKLLWTCGPAIMIYLIVLSTVTGWWNLLYKIVVLGAFFTFIAALAAVHQVKGWTDGSKEETGEAKEGRQA